MVVMAAIVKVVQMVVVEMFLALLPVGLILVNTLVVVAKEEGAVVLVAEEVEAVVLVAEEKKVVALVANVAIRSEMTKNN